MYVIGKRGFWNGKQLTGWLNKIKINSKWITIMGYGILAFYFIST